MHSTAKMPYYGYKDHGYIFTIIPPTSIPAVLYNDQNVSPHFHEDTLKTPDTAKLTTRCTKWYYGLLELLRSPIFCFRLEQAAHSSSLTILTIASSTLQKKNTTDAYTVNGK